MENPIHLKFSSKILLTLFLIWNPAKATRNSSTGSFICQRKGIFPDETNCKKYYICSPYASSYVTIHLKCPLNINFDEDTGLCLFSSPCRYPTSGNEKSNNSTSPSSETNYETSPVMLTPQSTTFSNETKESMNMTHTTELEKITDSPNVTSEPCGYFEGTGYSTCRSEGRFGNLNDPSCQTYYLCSLLTNGSFIRTQYSCPETSYFNPHKQTCDFNYKCPCRNAYQTASTELMNSLDFTHSDDTEKPTTAIQTSTQGTTKMTDGSISISSQICEYTEDSEYLSCRNEGRFRNLNDLTCRTYYFCDLLRNGSFIKTQYKCPETSYFNTATRMCDINYKCPCRTTSNEFLTSLSPIHSTRYRESTTCIRTNTPGATKIADAPITTSETCEYIEDSGYFHCSSRGRFRNLNDPTCRSYFLCNLLRNGSLLRSPYSCPETSYFNPLTQTCDVNYKCPCRSVSLTTTTGFRTTLSPYNSTGTRDQKTPLLTTTPETKDKSMITSEAPDRPGEITAIQTNTNEMGDEPNASVTTSGTCEYIDDSGYFSCTRKGRFRNLNDPTCRTYFLCSLLRNGTFLSTQYSCPGTSYFNPPTQTCDVNYECPCRSASQAATTGHTTTSTPIYSEGTTEQKTSVRIITPGMTETADVSITTSVPCEYIKDSGNFSCSKQGRFRNLEDLTCRTYYLCNLLRNGSFMMTQYSCPETSIFNPPEQKCDMNYKCPCQSVPPTPTDIMITTLIPDYSHGTRGQTASIRTTTPELIETTNASMNTSAILTETEEPTSSSRSTIPEMTDTTNSPITISDNCNYIEDSGYFTCSNKGRFQNLNDPTCRTYYLCNLLRNGSFRRTQYSCPEKSYFNPHTRTCDVEYKCPCQIASLSTKTTFMTSLSPTAHTETGKQTISFRTTELETTEILNTSMIISTFSTGTEFTTPVRTTTSGTTEPTNDSITTPTFCEYIEDSGYFFCRHKGRFRNLNDLTCRTYYLCNMLRNGSFIMTKYSCPESSFFNPPTQKCDINYHCPCQSASSSPRPEVITSPSPTHSTSSQQTFSFRTAEPETTDTTNSSITTSDNCNYIDDSGYFTCSNKGRFQNLNDPTCRTYFLCNMLRNGSFRRTQYSCPEKSYFNPHTQTCDVEYKCPCQSASLSTTTTFMTSLSPTDHTETGEETISFRTTELGTTGISNTSMITSTFSTGTEFTTPVQTITSGVTEPTNDSITTPTFCENIEDSGYFFCRHKGRFRNLNDLTCRTYYLCNMLRNGSFIMTKYSCPESSFFNPPTQKCDINYHCPCQSTSSTPIPEVITSPSPTHSTSSQQTFSFRTAEPETTDTTNSSITTSDNCNYIEDSGYFTCSNKGRFQNLNDPTCRTYFLCNMLRNGSFRRTQYSCPEKSYFNPHTQTCDVEYKCPCQSASLSTTTSFMTSLSPTDHTETGEETISFRTTELGTTGISNTSMITSTFSTGTEFTTSVQTITSGVTEPTNDSITTPTFCEYIEDSGYFFCRHKGRFRNLNDLTCRTYYLCNMLRNGSFIMTKYSCPESSFFNPPTQKCDINYHCPCQSASSTPRPEVITSPSPTHSTSSQQTFSFRTAEPGTTDTTNSSITTSDNCNYIEDSGYFNCSNKGRFQNLNDPTCRTYFLCNMLRNGSFRRTQYSCPEKSYFNPHTQTCDVEYKCPCQSASLSTTTTFMTSLSPTDHTETGEETISFRTTELGTTDISNTSMITSTFSTGTEFTTSVQTITSGVTEPTNDSITTPTFCEYIEDSGYFFCRHKGRFRNLNDLTCRTYYLCNMLRNGSFIMTKYSCPETSFFNPPTQKCDINYHCPCQSASSTPRPEVITSPSPTHSTSSQQTFSFRTAEPETTDTTNSSITTSDNCIYIEDSGYFNCSNKGRFQNLNDPTCRTYFLCNMLRNGSFRRTQYSCPEKSYFNPHTQTCDVEYKCPCQSASLSTTTTFMTSLSPTDHTETGKETISFRTTELGTTEISNTSMITSTFSTGTEFTTSVQTITSGVTEPTNDSITTPTFCEYIEDSGYFFCRHKGRFRNHNDLTCRTYFLCNMLRNGSFIMTKYSCPESSFFNPPTQKCDINYHCPCQSASSSPRPEVITSPSPTHSTSSREQTFSFQTAEPETTDTTNSSITTSDNCNYIEDSGYFTCRNKGRFQNLNDPTCRTYFLCNMLRNGSFRRTQYSCPEKSYFNPHTQTCDVEYRCPCQSASLTNN